MKDGPLDCFAIAASVQSHERTARAVADGALRAAERLQNDWNTFITITPELAHRQAERVDRFVGQGRRLRLAGVPIAAKDLIDVEGVPTTCGSRAFSNRVAERDAAVIRRLTDAGAVVVGKLNMHECAFGFTGENPTFGDCNNPWDRQRIAGGSSSGSAVAVALGVCPFTLGSDTGGSIRQPAALCGLVGLKPTYGRVSRAGVVPLSWSMDHVGPFTRTAKEAALVLEVLAGPDADDDTTSDREVPNYTALLDRPLQGVRIGIPEAWFFDALEPAVASAVDSAIQTLVDVGCQRTKLELPHMNEVLGAHRAIIISEASAYHRPFLETSANAYTDDIRTLLLGGLFLPAVDYLQAQRVRRTVCRAWAEVFRTVDCLVTPTLPIVATRFGQESATLPGGEKPLVRAYLDLLLPFNLTGHPAVSVPCGFCKETLPIGLQIVGKPFDEATILRVAHQYQQHTSWHRRMPSSA